MLRVFHELCEIFAELQRNSAKTEADDNLLRYMKNSGLISFYSMYTMGELPREIADAMNEKIIQRQLDKQNQIFDMFEKLKKEDRKGNCQNPRLLNFIRSRGVISVYSMYMLGELPKDIQVAMDKILNQRVKQKV